MAEITAKESPFTPGRPVQPEYFVARIGEIQRLERAIRQTVSGRNENIFISGERGIGKSSLARFVRYLAEKEYNLVGTHCCLGGATNLQEMMGAVFRQLLQDCTDKSLFDRLRTLFGDYVEGLSLFGVEVQFTKNTDKLQALANNFLPALRKIHEESAKNGKKGLILILDDLNGITDTPRFSPFLKSFVDGLATSGKPLPILMILVGLPQRREDLIKHQPSVARIFDIVDLPTMTNSESEQFFIRMFGRPAISVTDEALRTMVALSGGNPMLMHEVGDAVFWQDSDGQIDPSDARIGITEAARNVGRKYIGTQVSNVLRNKTYSSILLRMGKKLPIGATFERQELLKEKASEKERKNLDNFLNKIKRLGIMKDAEVRGEYTFVNPLYHLYIWYEAKNKKG
ncbi:MAG: hypothetical protein A2Z25_04315 [Planctomycetes bacterium RBG_16_55_9]|nr:MAG: hypothetical protein A2Z25_04315 [Planctomycetes bacterium RBG_16_55_9]